VTIALDLGASQFRSMRRVEGRLVVRSTASIYAVLADSPAHRRLLDQAGIPFSLSEGDIVLLGKSAVESASLFRVSSRQLLPGGHVPASDPLGRQLISCLIEAVLPVAPAGKPICTVTLPSGTAPETRKSRADAEFLSRIVRLQGYEPSFVSAAHSLVLAELAAAAFTGIGFVFGASGCEAALVHRGQLLCCARTGFGGNMIDQRLRERGFVEPVSTNVEDESSTGIVDAITLQQFREAVVPSETASSASVEHVVAALLRQACENLVAAFDAELRRTPHATTLPQPVAIVCSGGLTATPGIAALIADVVGQCSLPLECSVPRVASAATRSVLRGLLISGELDSPREATRRSA